MNSFSVGHLLAVGPSLHVVCGALRKSSFSFKRNCQLEIASRLGMGAYVYFFFVLEPHLFWTCAGPVQTATVAVYVGTSTMSGRYFSWSHPSSLALTIFLLPLPCGSLSPKGKEFDEDFLFRIACTKVYHSLHIFHLSL